jgi:hypothetical protein
MEAYIFSLFLLFALVDSILRLRRQFPHDIYAIWYVFSFFFLLFFSLYLFAEKDGKAVTDVLGPSLAPTLNAAYGYLTKVDDELWLVGAIVYLGIFPQLLTYLLGGLSGSATAPKFVRQISMVAVWSLIKFMAGLAGILLSDPFAKLCLGGQSLPKDVLQGIIFITAAFFLARLHRQYFDREFVLPITLGLHIQIRAPILARIHKYLTRHARRTTQVPGVTQTPERNLETLNVLEEMLGDYEGQHVLDRTLGSVIAPDGEGLRLALPGAMSVNLRGGMARYMVYQLLLVRRLLVMRSFVRKHRAVKPQQRGPARMLRKRLRHLWFELHRVIEVMRPR